VQDWIIRPQIKTVPGVAGVDGIGGFEKQYHVQPKVGVVRLERPGDVGE
jgi:Cu/Ag efflux pump CusA